MTPKARLVVDASVAVKWLVEEDRSAEAAALYDADLHAPTLILLEIGNVLRTLAARGQLAANDAAEAFRLFLTAPVSVHDPDAATLEAALSHALDLRHPIYDCVYLALAERLSCPLVTADRRFARAAAATDRVVTLDAMRAL